MLITVSHCTAICQSVAEVQLIDVALLGTVSSKFIIFLMTAHDFSNKTLISLQNWTIIYLNGVYENGLESNLHLVIYKKIA